MSGVKGKHYLSALPLGTSEPNTGLQGKTLTKSDGPLHAMPCEFQG